MKPRLITLAVLALGGQGGGVLVDWIVDLAEHAGWTAQATSVAGVAQRTGATIYYIELMPPTPGRQPVMALMPVSGEVDLLIAAELMEAGRAVERGLVAPARTTVITSSHRTYAVQEKVAPGNAVADGAAVLDWVREHARRLVVDDMQALAVANGSVISACLFGALAGSGELPFDDAAFEAVVERSGVGVKASLAALRAGAQLARQAGEARAAGPSAMETPPRPLPERAASAALQPLVERIRTQFPAGAWPWLGEGLARVVDWQDADYGREYLDHVARFAAHDRTPDAALGIEAARWIAVAMAYDDVIRVADLKTRATRTERLRGEVGAASGDGEVIGVEEYFHPRLEELLGLLPERWARRVEGSAWLSGWISRRLAVGRRIHTHTVGGYLQLRLAAGLRTRRRASRRHAEEQRHLRDWLARAEAALQDGDPLLAAEILRCRRLVKGYSDTHARGLGRFDRLMRAADALRGQPAAATTLARLREAALADAEGRALGELERGLNLDALQTR